MAIKDKINTAKEVFSDTRSRMVVIILAIIVVVVLVVAFLKFKSSEVAPAGRGSSLAGVPGITSIPGMGEPTREYAKLQEQQNIQLAEEAARKGTSAIPTVVRTTYLDIGASADSSGDVSGAGCSVSDLERARIAGVNATELRCRGCSLDALRAAGFTAGELRVAGFNANELKGAGFDASELKNAGFGAKELTLAGFDVKVLAASGFTVGELKSAGFGDKQLKGVGFSSDAIKAASVDGVCSVRKLQESRSKGIKASDLRKLGCNASALRAAGFTALELKLAGFSAGELLAAGFSISELLAAGFSAAELKSAGVTAKAMSDAGFTNDKLTAAGFTAGDLVRAGVVKEGLRTALAEASSCDVKSLKKARASGISAGKLRKRGCSATALRAAGFTAAELKAAGFSAAELLAAGFSVVELKAAGFTVSELLAAGVSIEDLRKAGFNIKSLKEAGISASDLYAAGFPPENLKAAGFTDKDVQEATVEAVAGQDVSSLQDSLAKLKEKQIAGMGDQEMADFISQQQAMMMMQSNQLFSAWNQAPSQRYVEGEREDDKDKNKVAISSMSKKVKQEVVDTKNLDIFKAGDILFATLDTGINSDENSPVMATVVQGPLKGSKVIGNFRRVDEKVLLNFTVISVPRLSKSIALNAVAVDPNTNRTALATRVNTHRFMRYGSMLGAGFLSGLGQAFQNAGGEIQTTTTGTVAKMPALTIAEKTIVAAGNMAQKFGEVMAAKVNTPPTVKVDAGVGIGLLLMADLAVAKDQKRIGWLKR